MRRLTAESRQEPTNPAMAAKPSSTLPQPEKLSSSTPLKISTEIDPRYASMTLASLESVGLTGSIPRISDTDGFFSAFIRSFLNLDRIQRGRLTCSVLVKPPISVISSILLRFYLAVNISLYDLFGDSQNIGNKWILVNRSIDITVN